MEIGLWIRYGKLVPGREAAAIVLFDEARRYFTEKLTAGVLTYFEPFMLFTSDREQETGFMILKGSAPEMFKLIEEEQFLRLSEKAMMLVEHFQTDLLTVGEEVLREIERSSAVRAELGIA